MTIKLSTNLAMVQQLRDGVNTVFSGDSEIVFGRDTAAALLADAEHAHEFHALVNNPNTAEFLEAVKLEAAHQRDRWGDAHDRGKSAENWFWLIGYLAGKCLRACITGDKQKALHHTISSAAALANWFEAIRRDETGTGLGNDADIKPVEISRFENAEAKAIGADLDPSSLEHGEVRPC
ncbi:MAG: hypothetical protein V4573_17765 [Pseudomonadota bacterium]